MKTRTLISILKTRLAADENNPTSQHLIRELIKALIRLDGYEKKDEAERQNKKHEEN